MNYTLLCLEESYLKIWLLNRVQRKKILYNATGSTRQYICITSITKVLRTTDLQMLDEKLKVHLLKLLYKPFFVDTDA